MLKVNEAEKAMPRLLTEKSKDTWDAKCKCEGFVRALKRSKKLEIEALKALNSWKNIL